MSRVLLYELNEVPWEIIDLYVAERPQSELARVVPLSRCATTRNDDPAHLSPWRTWPTFHTGLYSEEHNSLDLGQDPSTFAGTNIWDIAEGHGLRIGLFGVLQTWPPRPFEQGSFYVPDTFARTPVTVPVELEQFQRFNLAMTSEMAFSADTSLHAGQLVSAGFDLLRRGLQPASVARIARHLIRERRDPRFKAARSILQAIPAFDLYWRLHRRSSPHLSIFFTNHVAGMMHRFWGDAVPGYSETFNYVVDDVFARFVIDAMDVFDAHLRKLVAYVDRNADTVLIIASSMGQAGVPYEHVAETYVVEDALKLAGALRLGPAEKGLAMHPMNSLMFPTVPAAERGSQLLASVSVSDEPLFTDIKVDGRSVTYRVRLEIEGSSLERNVQYRTDSTEPEVHGVISDIGVSTARRLGGGNSAYHVPEGTYITYGPTVPADSSRTVMDVRLASSDILAHLGIHASTPFPSAP